MTSVATINDVAAQIAQGKALHTLLSGLGTGPGTAATATSGYFSLNIAANIIGTTYPNTLQSFMPGVPAADFRSVLTYLVQNRGGYLALLYTLGTLNLTATGNQFTHDAATFPVLGKKFGQSGQPINLIPLLYVTTATSTTAPAFMLNASGGTAGYVNQDGSGVIGTKTFTFPAATTNAQSCFILRLEDGDSSIQDITQIDVTTASATGAATLYGMQKISNFSVPTTQLSVYDSLLGGMGLQNLNPAAATSGSATVILAAVTMFNGGITLYGYNVAVRTAK